jgi:hypothetical protein
MKIDIPFDPKTMYSIAFYSSCAQKKNKTFIILYSADQKKDACADGWDLFLEYGKSRV